MGILYQGTEEEVRALDAFVKLMRAANSVSTRVHRHLLAERLTESQLGVLEAVYHLGPLCQRDLAKKLLKSGGNLTLVVDNLEKRGFVRRERSSEDRRFVTVHLTEAGRSLVQRVFPRHVEGIVTAMSRLSAAEQDRLGALCRKLGRAAVAV